MTRNHIAVVIYISQAESEAAIKELPHSGFDIQKLTVIDQHSGMSCDRWGHQCAGLYNMKIPKDCVHQCETALKIGKFIVIAQWTAGEVASGCEEINRTHPESVEEHQFSFAGAETDMRV